MENWVSFISIKEFISNVGDMRNKYRQPDDICLVIPGRKLAKGGKARCLASATH